MLNDHINWDSHLEPPHYEIDWDSYVEVLIDGEWRLVEIEDDEIDTTFVEIEEAELEDLIESYEAEQRAIEALIASEPMQPQFWINRAYSTTIQALMGARSVKIVEFKENDTHNKLIFELADTKGDPKRFEAEIENAIRQIVEKNFGTIFYYGEVNDGKARLTIM